MKFIAIFKLKEEKTWRRQEFKTADERHEFFMNWSDKLEHWFTRIE
jgi:hypothetical protein